MKDTNDGRTWTEMDVRQLMACLKGAIQLRILQNIYAGQGQSMMSDARRNSLG